MAGRLGRRTAHLVHDAITVVPQSDRIRWLVDVTGLTADQTGLRVLGGAYRRLLRGGRQMVLLGASPQLRQILRRLRLAEHASRAAATRRPEPRPLRMRERHGEPAKARPTRAYGTVAPAGPAPRRAPRPRR